MRDLQDHPEFVSEAEWEVYAWFGLAISHAQGLESQLRLVATAVNAAAAKSVTQQEWVELYDRHGKLTLGRLLAAVRPTGVLSEDLVRSVREAVELRNTLAHEYFWPHSGKLNHNAPPSEMIRELQSAASLFYNLSPVLEDVVQSLLGRLDVSRAEAERATVRSEDASYEAAVENSRTKRS